MKNVTANTQAKDVCILIVHFGVQAVIKTVNGWQFELFFFTSLSKLLSCKKIHVMAYNPQWNRLMEQYYCSLKSALQTHLLILLGLRAVVKLDLNHSSVKLLSGTTLCLLSLFFLDQSLKFPDIILVNRISNFAYKQSGKCLNPLYIPTLMKSCTYIFVQDQARYSTLQTQYKRPYKVIERWNKFFSVRIGKNLVCVLLDKLKPAYLLDTSLDVQPCLPSLKTQLGLTESHKVQQTN